MGIRKREYLKLNCNIKKIYIYLLSRVPALPTGNDPIGITRYELIVWQVVRPLKIQTPIVRSGEYI